MTTDPPPQTFTPLDESQRRFFAVYLDVVQYGDGGFGDNWARRWQWVVMPPLKMGGGIVLFNRQQSDPKNRSVWKSNYLADAVSAMGDITFYLNQHGKRELRGPVTVEISREELESYVAGNRPKTPWKVLERAQRYVTFKI